VSISSNFLFFTKFDFGLLFGFRKKWKKGKKNKAKTDVSLLLCTHAAFKISNLKKL